ncbi:MAG: hypothetical protein QXG17_01585 [Sulfolobales archaeon]
MSSSVLVLYMGKEGNTEIRLFDDTGMLKREVLAESIKHVRVYASECSTDISFAEFEAAIVVKVSGNISFEQKGNVLEVRCVGN